MSDLLHTHLTFGFHDDCPACEQLKADLARCAEQPVLATLASV